MSSNAKPSTKAPFTQSASAEKKQESTPTSAQTAEAMATFQAQREAASWAASHTRRPFGRR